MFPVPSVSDSQVTTFLGCEACRKNRQYVSPNYALEHLHSHHFQCEHPVSEARPFDDPCFVWLVPSEYIYPEDEWKAHIQDVERFTNRLLDLKRCTYELHCLVATPSTGVSTTFNSALPKSLFYAFEEILSMFVMMSKELSFANSPQTGRSDANVRFSRMHKMQKRSQTTFDSALSRLGEAKTDVILLGTNPRTHDVQGLDAIGPEFLAVALAINLQNRPIHPDTSDNAIEAYQKYMSKLKYEASRRPRRRIFLDIHSLENELEALSHLLESQSEVLRNYRDLLAPESYRVTNTTREGLFELEHWYISSHMKNLAAGRSDIERLESKASLLRDHLKQSIDILEEGHGKAIRVFTIVTLFFLPL